MRRAYLVVIVALVAGIALAGAILGGRDPSGTDRAGAPAANPANAADPDSATRLPPVLRWEDDGAAAPPVTLLVDGAAETLRAWAYCYDRVCVDGSPDRVLVEVDEQDRAAFSFPDPGWTFTAAFVDLDDDAGRRLPGPVTVTGDHTFTLDPAVPAGRYRVDLFGRGPEGGDVISSFAWTTPAGGPSPATADR